MREGGGRRGRLDGEGTALDGRPWLAVVVQPPEDELYLLLDLGELGFGLVVVYRGGEGYAWLHFLSVASS